MSAPLTDSALYNIIYILIIDVIIDSNMDIKRIKALENLGLSHKEALVYSALLSMKKGGVLGISKRAGTKRPTTNLVLESLKKKKLVTSTKYRDVLDFRALPIGALKQYVKRQESAVRKFVPAMHKEYKKTEQPLRLRSYSKDVHGVKILLEKSLREKKKMHIIGQSSHLANYLGDYWPFYHKRSNQKGIAPKVKERKGDVMLFIWSNKVAFVEFGDQLQVFGFKNKEVSEMYQNIWNNY